MLAALLLLFALFAIPGAIVMYATLRVHIPAQEAHIEAQAQAIADQLQYERFCNPAYQDALDRQHNRRQLPVTQYSTLVSPEMASWVQVLPVHKPIAQIAAPVVESDLVTLPHADSFAAMLALVGPSRFCLGYGASGPIFGSIDDLLSTAIVGRPGTGKTTLLRFETAQLLAAGGTPMIWDPHGNIADELGDLLEVQEGPQEIDAAALRLERQLDYRLKERRDGRKPGNTILLLADEWPIIAAACAHAIATMRRIVLEGRKVGMYALISGQGLPAALLEGTLVRDALSSRYVFHTTSQQARLAGLDNETAKALLAQLDTAGPGRAILASARLKPEVVAIPDTRVDDIRRCITPERETPVSPGKRASVVVESTAVNVSREMDPEEETDISPVSSDTRNTIRRLRERGMAHREIAPIVGLAGKKYTQYQAICREEGIA